MAASRSGSGWMITRRRSLGVDLAAHGAVEFQPVDHAGDRPGGAQTELLAELAGGERAVLGQEIWAAQVGDVSAHPVGDGLVEQDAVGGAGLGHPLQLGAAPPGLGGHRTLGRHAKGALRPGYRPWRHAVSQLSLGPFGWVNTIAILLAAGGLLAIFPDDPGLGYPPGMLAQQSLYGLVHGLAGTVAFGCLSAACFVLARRFAGDLAWRGWARYSALTGVVGAAGYLVTDRT